MKIFRWEMLTQFIYSAKCKKDLLLVVDTSYSVGKHSFDMKVKPFLERLVLDPLLNVAEDGTQIGLILFSAASKTKIKLNLGQIHDANKLAQQIKSLQWNVVSGDRTRTDIALFYANEVREMLR